MPKAPEPIVITDFNQGGLADSEYSGIPNSLAAMVGWDVHSKPALLRVAQKLTKDSSTTVTAFCKCAVNSSNGAQYWFSNTDGKIWERPSAGTFRLVHTTTPAAGGAGCLGAVEYQGRIWWFTESRGHYIAVGDADDNDWSTDAVEDEFTFDITDATFHPHEIQNQVLYIGDGNQVAQIDVTTVSTNALDIKTPLRISALGKIGTDLLIGTYVADTVTATEILRWDTWSPSFKASDTIPEVGINAFLPSDNVVFVQAGLAGNIYTYNNANQLEIYKKVLGDYSPTATAKVHAQSVANLGGDVLFGLSNVTGNPALELVYRIGRNSHNYPYILDQPYPISERDTGAFVTSGIEIGAILAVGSLIYVAWKNSTTYGVDKLDAANKLDGAYLETRIARTGRIFKDNLAQVNVPYASMPASCSLAFTLDINYAGYGSALAVINDSNNRVYSTHNTSREFNTLQLKVTATTSSNTAPEIESIIMTRS